MVINLFKTLFVMLHVDYNTELLFFFYFESGCLTLEQKMNFKTYDLKILHPWGNFKKKGNTSIKMNAKKKHIQQS